MFKIVPYGMSVDHAVMAVVHLNHDGLAAPVLLVLMLTAVSVP
jgi:hypothetical protein